MFWQAVTLHLLRTCLCYVQAIIEWLLIAACVYCVLHIVLVMQATSCTTCMRIDTLHDAKRIDGYAACAYDLPARKVCCWCEVLGRILGSTLTALPGPGLARTETKVRYALQQ